MTTQAWVAIAIFVASYIAIATEKIDRTVVALVGAALMLIVGSIDQADAFLHIDLNVIFLLAGMMIIVNIIKRSGLFEWLAISSAKLSKGRPLLLLIVLSLLTAVISAFLDNVTTVLLIAPITLLIAGTLRVDPLPFLISEALASNIGGTATLIGDPPNIIIGSAAKLGFNDFIIHLTPIVMLVLVVFLLSSTFLFGKELRSRTPNVAALNDLNARKAIRDKYLVWKSLAILGIVIVMFVLHEALHLMPATIALGGAGLLLLASQLPPREKKTDPIETILAEIDWHTLFFFIGMFIMISGLESTGVIKELLRIIIAANMGKVFLLSMIILWGSALLTFVTSSVPFVIAMLPVIRGLASQGVQPIEPLWWALALGACLGGNGTLIGAAANMVIAGISNKSGHKISFWAFAKKGMPTTIISLILSSIYIWLRYFVLAR
ncbi:ArsB/NhaD family transporter [bacterium]|nr:ArsB/NhaD family transporter [bacterium]